MSVTSRLMQLSEDKRPGFMKAIDEIFEKPLHQQSPMNIIDSNGESDELDEILLPEVPESHPLGDKGDEYDDEEQLQQMSKSRKRNLRKKKAKMTVKLNV